MVLISAKSWELIQRRDRLNRPFLTFSYYDGWGTYRLSLGGLGDAIHCIHGFLGYSEEVLAGTLYFLNNDGCLIIRHNPGTNPPDPLIENVRCQLCGLPCVACLFVCRAAAGIVLSLVTTA